MPGLYKQFVLLICLIFSAVSLARADSTVLEIITLQYRTAEQITMIRPMLDASGSVSGMQNQLIVRTTPANLNEIRQILTTLDRYPRRLMITVRQNGEANRNRSEAGISADVRVGRNGRIIVPDARNQGTYGNASNGVQGRILSRQSNERDAQLQQVQVIEGGQAFISVGQSVPVLQQTITRTVNGVMVTDSVAYQGIASGFYVSPRIGNGNQVIMDISTQDDTPGRQGPGSANIQHAKTTLAAKLGEWISIGGMTQDRSGSADVNLSTARSNDFDQRSIQVKVDEIK